MKRRFGFPAALLITAAVWGAATAAQAAYFVRPYVQLGAGVVDGLQINGVTESSQNFQSALQAEVSLDEGTIRNYLQLTGPGTFSQSAGVMGDRLRFSGASGTTVNFGFSFDGNITAPARDPERNSNLQIGLFASLYVHDVGAGATWANFDQLSGARVSQIRFIDFSNPAEDLDVDVLEDLSGSVFIEEGASSSFDVFYSVSIFTALNDNPGTVTMDFLNTGRARIGTAPGVSFTSDSGAFLGSAKTQTVPEPGALLLTLVALGALLRGQQQRRQHQHQQQQQA